MARREQLPEPGAEQPMGVTAANRVDEQLDETVIYHEEEASGFFSGKPTGNVLMSESTTMRQPGGRYAFGSGDRPLEGYTIKRAVGRGGFGEVYYATSDSGREVALKLILRNLDVERRGVVQCMNLKHPNLLTIFDLKSNEAGDAFVVMEYVAGPSLAQVLRENPDGLPADEVRHWLRGLVEGVAYLHDHGVVHRDLKPANLFMEEGVVKIGDYGLAKLITASHGSEHSESIGTCHYMAPEIGSGKYNKPIDVYAVGVILYEMLVGRVPFDGETVNEILMKHLTARPDVSVLPEEYRKIVSRALAKDPNQRPSRIYDLLLPADAPKTPEIRIIGTRGAGATVRPSAPSAEEIHRIEDEEPVFYIGPDTVPPGRTASIPSRIAADWRRMRDAKARRAPRAPSRAAGFVRRAVDDPGLGAARGARPAHQPPEPPQTPTGRACIAEVTASMIWAALLVAMLVLPAAAALGVDPARETTRIVFLYGTALLATWAALLLNKVLEARKVDAVSRRMTAAFVGVGVGGAAYLLARGLMLEPRMAALAPVYFGALYAGTSGWPGPSARDRKKRFRLTPFAWTLVLAAALVPLWDHHPAEGPAIAAIVVAAVQLVSPWSERAARYAEYVRALEKSGDRTRAA
ncbi:serine/threonine-protein kinase [Planctomyces sp. SH-PL62]|uniref:serine/threonine-protein kinase n=1 Tax=Planctomyces sp. SH-PL62 TaxID=1636152 RepID=UPI0018D43984|nr:serine/threonine-protein kinase [Planctomyces sp. SH-PL62]